MKMTKRIFIALLILAVTVSTFAFASSAQEEDGFDFGYVLEYFEEPTLFDYDFAKEGVDYSSSLLVKRPDKLKEELVALEDGTVTGYLSLAVASSTSWGDTFPDNHVFFNWSSDEAIDDFMVKMTVSGTKGEGDDSSLPRIVISVADVECADASVGSETGAVVAALDYRNGYFYYVRKNVDAEGVVTTEEVTTPFALVDGAWYSLALVYDAESAFATITITDVADATNTYTVEDAYVPYTAIKNLRVGAFGTDRGTSRGTVMNFAELCAFGGVYDRVPSNRQSDIEATVVQMYNAFTSDEVTLDEQSEICEIVAKLIEYGFTTEDEETAAALEELSKGVVPFFNGKLAQCIDTYATLTVYAEKRALVDATLAYVDALKNIDLTAQPDDLVAEIDENMAVVESLDYELINVEDSSLRFIADASTVGAVDLLDYNAVNEVYTKLCVHTPDPTYEGVEEYYDLYLDVLNAKTNITNKGRKFINEVDVAYNTSLAFNTRADAFIAAKNAYYDNTTFPGITEALSKYDEIYEDMTLEIEKADNFIKFVTRADYADYVTAKQENLDEAKKYIDCQPDYKGVAEAKLLMVEVQAYIDEQISNAKAYIEAVNELDILSGDLLIAGIKRAQELQIKGNVLGVEGVAEANIKLNQLVSSMELEDKYCEYFLRLVESIDKTTDAKELFKLLLEAKDAEQYANPRAAGVFEASSKLEKAMTNYNKRVNAANGTFEEANEVAIKTCAIGKDVNPVADRVVALVKKFFEE